METSFPDRYDILKKYILFKAFIVIILFLALSACEPKKEYTVDPIPVLDKVVQIDSGYTRVRVLNTGASAKLFCGEKGHFDSYSIMKFEALPDTFKTFDSIFVRFVSDTCTCVFTFYKLKQEWSEDSTYDWNDIGSLIDTANPITVANMYPIHIDTPLVDSNSLVFLGDSLSLDPSTISAIEDYGLAIHTDRFYSFNAARATRLKLIPGDDYVSCLEDAYLVKNPFQDTTFSDSLLVGKGISLRTHLYIPRDSLPLRLNKIAKAELFFDDADSIPFNLTAVISTSGYALDAYNYVEDDTLKFELGAFFRRVPSDTIFHVVVRSSNELNGIEVKSIGDLASSKIRFIWVEFP